MTSAFKNIQILKSAGGNLIILRTCFVNRPEPTEDSMRVPQTTKALHCLGDQE